MSRTQLVRNLLATQQQEFFRKLYCDGESRRQSNSKSSWNWANITESCAVCPEYISGYQCKIFFCGHALYSCLSITAASAGLRRTCIGANNEAGIVWQMASQAISCGLEVALMACQIHQGHHLRRPSNVLRRRVAAEHLIIQNVALAVQLQSQE